MKPDVLALTLNEALIACAEAGIKADVVITRPTRGFVPGEARVVRCIRLSETELVLTVAFEQKGEGGVWSGL
ncbi:MAG: hypothetical protein AB1815_07335 [Bacillota bacterium]|jgi:hypothetical protein